MKVTSKYSIIHDENPKEMNAQSYVNPMNVFS